MTLKTCPQGHPTAFRRNCPVCASAKLRKRQEEREHRNRSLAAKEREAHKREVGR